MNGSKTFRALIDYTVWSALGSGLCLWLAPDHANAQIQNQPVEIISEAPISSFSERSGLWPSQSISSDRVASDKSELTEKLNSLPGVQARTAGSPVLSIRGSAQADRALRLFDGVPLNMADGLGASETLLPTETVGSLSLIKGPSSVFYGGSAMAGALDHHLRFFDRPAIKVSGADEGSQLGTRSAFVALPLANSGRYFDRAQATLFHERAPGQFPFTSTTTTQSGRRSNNARDLTRATMAGDSQSGSWDFRSRAIAAKSVGESPGSLQFPSASTFETNASLLSIEARRALGSSEFVSVRASDARIWGLYDRDTSIQSTSSSTRSSLSLDSRVNASNTIGVRSFADLTTQDITGSYLGGVRFYQGEADLGQSVELPINSRLTLQPAYRYRSSSGNWFKALGLLYDSGGAREYLTYSEGFRAPSLSDRFGNYGTFRGNPGLLPERSWSVETGFQFERGTRYGGFLDGWALKGSVFDTHFDDLVDTQTIGANSTKINMGRARSMGGDASVACSVSIWTLGLDYAYLNARSESPSEPLRLSPEHQVSASVSQQLGPVIIEARETLWSEFYDRDPSTSQLRTLPSWNTFDFEFHTIGLTDWEFRGGVLNLFDRPRELTIGYPEPQRRFYASALRSF